MNKGALLSLLFLPRLLLSMGGTVPSGYPSTFMMGYVFEAHVDSAGRYVPAGQEFNTVDNYMAPIGSGWGATYKYLIGGPRAANGANCWWNAYPGSGGMPASFMNRANSRSYQPIFIYENLQAFTGNYAGGIYSAFQSSAFMGQYFSDWADLMTVVNAWLIANPGKVVTIDVEPDVWGYMQQNYNSNPASIPASVASATNPGGAYPWVPLTGYSNTVQGVARALLYIKAVRLGANSNRLKLAFHVSSWAVAPNPATQQGAVTVSSHAASVAGFVNACKTTTTAGVDWDLIFLDPADGDAGLYATNGLDPGGTTHWWDAANATQPTFNRYRDWVDALSTATSLRCMLWQMPIGNQAYKTMNNTAGHYQDNRAEYFLNPTNGTANICDWAAKGVIGILWGRGSIIQTGGTYTIGTGGPDYWFTTWGTDYSGGTQDNITNAGALGVNATVADDDGGYLRSRMPAYFAAPCVLPSVGTATPTYSRSPTPSPTRSSTASATPSATPSATRTATPSASASPTATPSATSSVTRSATPTYTLGTSATSTPTATPTATRTATSTTTASATASATRSATPTNTVGSSATYTPTATASATVSSTRSATSSATHSATPSATRTATPSATPTATRTISMTPSASASASPSRTTTPSATPTPTYTATPSISPTFTLAIGSPTPTPTVSASSTRSPTPSASSTITITASATPSATPSVVVSATHTPSITSTFTSGPSATATHTPMATRTASSTPSATLSRTASPSPTLTFTTGATATESPTPTTGSSAPSTEELELVDAVAWPQPNPYKVSVLVKGNCETLQVSVYTTAMVCLGQAQGVGPNAGGWMTLALPPQLAAAANGAYYLTVKASRAGKEAKPLKRRMVFVR